MLKKSIVNIVTVSTLTITLNAQSLFIKPGWNIIGNSDTRIDIQDKFSQYTDISIVWFYDPDKKTWKAYSNDEEITAKLTSYTTLESLEPFQGFWVYNNSLNNIEIVKEDYINAVAETDVENFKIIYKRDTTDASVSEITKSIYISDENNNIIATLKFLSSKYAGKSFYISANDKLYEGTFPQTDIGNTIETPYKLTLIE